ncbi:MAG TPA: aminoglycoside phosphotransferase family protein [Mucilaginibacter sp.]|jgi:Ser/Thr protein kinase RdoA (MazF antagonist)
MLNKILEAFDLDPKEYHALKFGDGLINNTWKVTDSKNEDMFILQRINKNVFISPLDIAENLSKVGKYLAQHHPDYLFVSPLPSVTGDYIIPYTDGEYYRLLPYVKNSVTINTVQTRDEAFEAARQFARFTRLLADFDTAELNYTLVDFHHLSKRFSQFQQALRSASKDRLNIASEAISKAQQLRGIAEMHSKIINEKLIPLRVIHHDTKISNILFDAGHKGLCVIDLDTAMPGYFISDVGDMMRTYLSPSNEEEQDLSKVKIREDFFAAIVEGYLSEMGNILTQTEKSLFVYSGKFMIYMQALRFLTDYLNNDIYYPVSYPKHNLVRAQNQLVLLDSYLQAENRFLEIINAYNVNPQ